MANDISLNFDEGNSIFYEYRNCCNASDWDFIKSKACMEICSFVKIAMITMQSKINKIGYVYSYIQNILNGLFSYLRFEFFRGIISKKYFREFRKMSDVVLSPSGRSICAARNYMGWNQQDLADLAKISLSTIKKMEDEQDRTSSTKRIFEKIHKVFWNNGILFLPDGGFRDSRGLMKIFEGVSGIIGFFDDIYDEAQRQTHEFLVLGVDESQFLEAYKKAGMGTIHRDRMRKLKEFKKSKAIVSKDDPNAHGSPYIEYRGLADDAFANVPFYVYNNKLALILWEETPKFIVINNASLADAYRKLFNYVWNLIDG